MKKKTLYALIALILIITAASSIYLYKKHTVKFSTISFENYEFETIDFPSPRPLFEQTATNAPEE